MLRLSCVLLMVMAAAASAQPDWEGLGISAAPSQFRFQPAPGAAEMPMGFASGIDFAYAPDAGAPDDADGWATPGSPGSTCNTRRVYYPRRQYTWSHPRWYTYDHHRAYYPRYQSYRWPSYRHGYRQNHRWSASWGRPVLPYAWRDRGHPGYGYYTTSCSW